MFYVYVLQSKKKGDQLYFGYTTNLKERLKKHNGGLVQSTKPYSPWRLVFYEAYRSKKDAKRRERYFKTTKGRKASKLMLKYSLAD